MKRNIRLHWMIVLLILFVVCIVIAILLQYTNTIPMIVLITISIVGRRFYPHKERLKEFQRF